MNKLQKTLTLGALVLSLNGCGRYVYSGLTSYGKTNVIQFPLLDGYSTRILIQKSDTTWRFHDFGTNGTLLDENDWASVEVKGKEIQKYEKNSFCDSTSTRFYKNGSNLEKAVYAKSREILRDRFEPMYKQILREATEKSVLKVR